MEIFDTTLTFNAFLVTLGVVLLILSPLFWHVCTTHGKIAGRHTPYEDLRDFVVGAEDVLKRKRYRRVQYIVEAPDGNWVCWVTVKKTWRGKLRASVDLKAVYFRALEHDTTQVMSYLQLCTFLNGLSKESGSAAVALLGLIK